MRRVFLGEKPVQGIYSLNSKHSSSSHGRQSIAASPFQVDFQNDNQLVFQLKCWEQGPREIKTRFEWLNALLHTAKNQNHFQATQQEENEFHYLTQAKFKCPALFGLNKDFY